jgi:hypothetical protein
MTVNRDSPAFRFVSALKEIATVAEAHPAAAQRGDLKALRSTTSAIMLALFPQYFKSRVVIGRRPKPGETVKVIAIRARS